LLVIMTRPYRIPEAVSAAVGAGLMLLCGILSPLDGAQAALSERG
jgi:Na+/H+ antiporter NhaD/arsenite permease-like protein